MLLMERIPNQTGYLLLTSDGAVIESGGELSNDERVAEIINSLITIANRLDPSDGGAYHKLSITYENHCYIICLSNKRIHIVKKSKLPKIVDVETVQAEPVIV